MLLRVLRLHSRSLGRGRLVGRIYDLDAAVDGRADWPGSLGLVLPYPTVTDPRRDAVLVHEITFDRFGAPLGQILVVGLVPLASV